MTPTPHDALFKSTFSRPSRAMSLVRSAFAPEVTRHLDTASARLTPGSFVDEALKERHSDLLFTLRLAGREAFAYLLLEHQSTPDPLMPYRMLRYMLGIWERWLAEHRDATQLPAILPLVVSHAPGGWTAATTLGELYDLDSEGLVDLAPWLPALRLSVDDLSAQDDAALRARASDALTQLVLLALKHARTARDIEPILLGWVELLRDLASTRSGVEALSRVMRYLYLVSPLTPHRAVTLFEAGRMGGNVKEAAMTGGERLLEQGRQEGLRKGLKEGRQEGRQEGVRSVLQVLLRFRFGELPPHALARIQAASAGELDRWVAEAETARTLEELLSP